MTSNGGRGTEFPLENGYTIFEEVHNSTTLEPTHEECFSFFREVHNPTPMDPSHYENFALTGPLGELVLSPTSYTSKFCSSNPNEVWVKGFFLWFHMKSMYIIFILLMMELLEHHIIYIIIIQISMGAPMMFT